MIATVKIENMHMGKVDNNGAVECAEGVKEHKVVLRCYAWVIFQTFL